MVGQQPLELPIGVRVPVPQPKKQGPLKRGPLLLPVKYPAYAAILTLSIFSFDHTDAFIVQALSGYMPLKRS